jgi:hypothetical protein
MYYIVETNKSFNQASADLESAVMRHGFGVLHVHDLGTTLRSKGIAFEEECKVFEVCNPGQAAKVLSTDMRLNMAVTRPLTQRITFIDLCRIVLGRRFRQLWIASCWHSLPWYRMFNRNQIFSYNYLFDQQSHNSLALTDIEGIGICAQAFQKRREGFGKL